MAMTGLVSGRPAVDPDRPGLAAAIGDEAGTAMNCSPHYSDMRTSTGKAPTGPVTAARTDRTRFTA